MKKVSLFAEFFLYYAARFEVWAKRFSRGVQTTIKVWIGTFWKKSLFDEQKHFLKNSSDFQQELVFLAIKFETVVESASYVYRRLFWEEKVFRWVFLIFIFALPEKMIPNWGRKSSAGLAKLDFKIRDECFGVFWFS